MRNELEVAEAEHAAALAEWRALGGREAAIRRGSVLTTVDGRKRERKLDPVERSAALSKLDAERGPTAGKLLEARAKLAEAKRGEVNATLAAEQVPAWTTAVEKVAAEREQVEAAIAALLVALWRYADAKQGERATASALVRAAGAALDDDGRQGIRAQLGHAVPVGVTSEGATMADRPKGILGSDDDARTLRALGEVFVTEPSYARANLSDRLRELVDEIER